MEVIVSGCLGQTVTASITFYVSYTVVLTKLMQSNHYLKLRVLKIEQMLSSKMSELSIPTPGIKIKMLY